MKILPKVIFKQIPIELEEEMFFDFLDHSWSKMITDKYPGFLKIKEIENKKERKAAINDEIVKLRAELTEKIAKGLETIKSSWLEVEQNVFKTLSEITQEEWSYKEIIGYISLNPVCPRYLDSWSFSVTYDCEDSNKVIAHEISHFLYFKKFKSIFPNIGKDRYESPHKEWILSEIVAVIILNDPRMVKIIGSGSGFYDNHRKLKVNGEFLTGIIQDLYNEFVLKQNNFSEFVERSMVTMQNL